MPGLVRLTDLVAVTGLLADFTNSIHHNCKNHSRIDMDTSLSLIGSGRNWPPPGLPIKPLPGARLGPGQTNIAFGITGSGRASGQQRD